MKLAVLHHEGAERVGVVTDDDTLVRLVPDVGGDLVEIVRGAPESLDHLRRAAASSTDVVELDRAALLAPIRRFQRDVLCTGWNYWAHFEEGVGKRGEHEVDRPDRPTFFSKAPGTVTAPFGPIAYDPAISQKWDYEAELALVLGPGGRSIGRSQAMQHVFGYLLANDISQRDLQRAHGGQWLKGKSVDGTMPLGPWIVTADEIDPGDVHLECLLNGETVQSASTSLMAYPIDELIAQLSWGMTLHPGDVLLTGTPEGVGNSKEPPVYLKEGDEIVVRGAGIGELANTIVRTDLSSSTVVST